jgi:hypothetical protein
MRAPWDVCGWHLHRQSWLGAVERLDLALFVDRENDGMGGRVDVEADNVLEFLSELRVVRQLERPDAMRGELVSLKDALHRSQAHACRLRQHSAGPMGCFSRRRDSAKSTTRCTVATGSGGLPGLRVLSRVSNALRHEPRLPPPYHRLGFAGSPHDLGRAAAVGGGKDDFGAPNMLLRRVAVADNRLKPTTIFRHDVDDNSCSHDESLNCPGQFGNRPNESDH